MSVTDIGHPPMCEFIKGKRHQYTELVFLPTTKEPHFADVFGREGEPPRPRHTVTGMRAYLVRHGEAKSAEVDPERGLTDAGVDRVRRVATHAVDDLGVRPARIFHSDKARARQTAEIWAELVGVPVEQADGLAPNDDPSRWATRLETDGHDVMLVGHLPHVERLAGLLVAGDPDRTLVGFPAGSLVVLDHGDGGWSVGGGPYS
jgi:phosphohistidine phosphatase